MFTVPYARDPVSFGDEWPTPCGYRYCHKPDHPVAPPTGGHEQCLMAEAKLYSNGIAAETNMLKRALHGGAL